MNIWMKIFIGKTNVLWYSELHVLEWMILLLTQEGVASTLVVQEDSNLVLGHPVGQVLPVARTAVLPDVDVVRFDIELQPKVLHYVDNPVGSERCLEASSPKSPSEMACESAWGSALGQQCHPGGLLFVAADVVDQVQRPGIDFPVD